MVQERSAESRLEEPVGQGIALRIPPQGQLLAVVIAHGEAAGVGNGGKAVQAAAVDLRLVLVKAVHQIPGFSVGRNVAADIERFVGEIRREAVVPCRRLPAGIHGGRQGNVYLAVQVGLPRFFRRRRGDAVGAGKEAIKIVEAVVLQVNHHDGPDLVQTLGRGFGENGGGKE